MDRSPAIRPGLVLLVLFVGLAVGGCASDRGVGSDPPVTPTPQPTSRQPLPAPSPSGPASTQPAASGTIVGRARDQSSGRPLADVYVVVGHRGIQRAAITGPDGHFEVRDVPAGQPAAILGFREHSYRYHTSEFDSDVVPTLRPGQTFEYAFVLRKLKDVGNQPKVSDPTISTAIAHPGDRVQFELTVTGGAGGPSDKVFAASPRLGRVAWLGATDGDRYRGDLTIPPDTAPGTYRFAFFGGSDQRRQPERFPTRVLRVQD